MVSSPRNAILESFKGLPDQEIISRIREVVRSAKTPRALTALTSILWNFTNGRRRSRLKSEVALPFAAAMRPKKD